MIILCDVLTHIKLLIKINNNASIGPTQILSIICSERNIASLNKE